MPQRTRLVRALALLALFAAPTVFAQNNLPDLSTATTPGGQPTSTGESSTSPTSGATSTNTNSQTSPTSSGQTTAETSNEATTTATFPDASTSTSMTASPFSLTGLPTIAGAGIPTMIVPYTANAPFMQKSNLPEGTVFIAVGGVLALLGATVLLWRGLVAWSINRSVKRAALIAVRGSDKGLGWGGGAAAAGGYKRPYYKEYEGGSSMSLDHLTSSGKNVKASGAYEDKKTPAAPPAGLFFSPTAQVSNRQSSVGGFDNRASGYLPAGYYASPAAEPAAGRNSTVIGGSLAPYARHSSVMNPSPSPPGSPSLPASRGTGNFYGASRDSGFRAASQENIRAVSRDGYGPQRISNVYMHPSSSSLAVGTGAGHTGSSEYLAGQRAPSAVFSDLLENHGNGPRERF